MESTRETQQHQSVTSTMGSGFSNAAPGRSFAPPAFQLQASESPIQRAIAGDSAKRHIAESEAGMLGYKTVSELEDGVESQIEDIGEEYFEEGKTYGFYPYGEYDGYYVVFRFIPGGMSDIFHAGPSTQHKYDKTIEEVRADKAAALKKEEEEKMNAEMATKEGHDKHFPKPFWEQ